MAQLKSIKKMDSLKSETTKITTTPNLSTNLDFPKRFSFHNDDIKQQSNNNFVSSESNFSNISISTLRQLMDHNGPDGAGQIVQQFGTVHQFCDQLCTSSEDGLTGNPQDLAHRRQCFGSNVIPPKPSKSFLYLVWEALNDATLIILLCSAIISLGLSFYSPPSETDAEINNTRILIKSNNKFSYKQQNNFGKFVFL